MMLKTLLAAAVICAASLPACAQSLVVGLGWNYFSYNQSKDTGTIDLEYHFAPFHEGARVDWAVGAVISDSTENDFYVGVGIVATVHMRNRWFAEFSAMPGYYSEGISINRLGGDLQFRTLAGLGRTLKNGNAFSVAINHRSNASTNPFNPGVNSLLVRYHVNF